MYRPALFSSRGVRFLMRRSHVIYTQKIPRKKYVEKRLHRWSSAFDKHEVTTRSSAGYPRVRHSAQKSPKGAARLAQQVRKIEVFSKRLSVQKSPKGAAGLAQQVCKIEVFLKRLSVQKSTPKNCPRKNRLQAQPDRHNKRARPSAQRPYGHSRMREGTQPRHTNYSCIRTARASHLTMVQPSG